MKFPLRVLRTAKKHQASARLRYLIYRLALEQCPRPSVRALCEEAGIDHSTVTTYITRGSFSSKLALEFQERFGRELAAAEWLTSPLKITTTK